MLLNVLDVLYILRLDVDGEDALVKTIIHALQHLVMLGIHRVNGKIFLYA